MHSGLANRPTGELTKAQLAELETFEFRIGPLSVLNMAVQNHDQILTSLSNNRRLLARVKDFERRGNMVLIRVRESEMRRRGTRRGRARIRLARISKMFLTGNNVVLVLRNSASVIRGGWDLVVVMMMMNFIYLTRGHHV
jgi:small nuclear ribonucleoprotein D2